MDGTEPETREAVVKGPLRRAYRLHPELFTSALPGRRGADHLVLGLFLPQAAIDLQGR